MLKHIYMYEIIYLVINLNRYNLQALKDKVIEINTTLKFEDKKNNKKIIFEIVYATIE